MGGKAVWPRETNPWQLSKTRQRPAEICKAALIVHTPTDKYSDSHFSNKTLTVVTPTLIACIIHDDHLWCSLWMMSLGARWIT